MTSHPSLARTRRFRVLPGFRLTLAGTLIYLALFLAAPLIACAVRVSTLTTAVAGLVYSSLYVQKGWLGQYLVPLGFHGAYSYTAIVLVLTFIGLPFVVRTLQPVLESFDHDVEEAAACLGASRGQVFWRVLFPGLVPAMVTGFALTFARGIGEYGSVVFVSGNMPFKTEIAPVLIVSRLEEFAYAEATAIAVVLLSISFLMLGLINLMQQRSARYADR